MRNFDEIMSKVRDAISVGGKRVFDKDIAEALGITQVNFATIKKRQKLPYSELLNFCATRKISINWLLYAQSPESLVEATNRVFMVRYFDIDASAGGGSDIEEGEAGSLMVDASFASLLGGESELAYIEALNVTGDSMEPLFSYDDVVFINRNKLELRDSAIYVIRGEDGLFIKRLKKDGKKLHLISENSVYEPMLVDATSVEIVGRVVAKLGSVS
jgi:phage repressor protein C with HTH and peptisase S24 domain